MASTVSDIDFPAAELDVSATTEHIAQITESHEGIRLPDDLAIESEAQEVSASGGSGVPTPSGDTPSSAPRVSAIDGGQDTDTVVKKSRRVRTGCLTCRERHLKCDEALHRCQNCRKSGRICRRGVRLNFIDTQTATPPHYLKPPVDAPFTFKDESRFIASEYVGGFEKYPPPEPAPSLQMDSILSTPHLTNPEIPSSLDALGMNAPSDDLNLIFGSDSHTMPFPILPDQNPVYSPFKSAKHQAINSTNHTCLKESEDILLLQAFVDEVGSWMDSLDSVHHFTDILPLHALEEPMLLRAFMACGARHLFFMDSSYGEGKASYLYDLASQDLFHTLQNQDRDSALCASTAVVLNVYELMSSKSTMSLPGMNHTASARALIKESHWDARTQGLGGACFWLNVGMELLNCLPLNWMLSWDPDTWGVDMHLSPAQPSVGGNEELWTHRMIYICAKIVNFRSSLALKSSADEVEAGQRYEEWSKYNDWCNQWAQFVPRSMMPLGHLDPWKTSSKSAFPEVWLIKRPAIVARLFYHTARILLTKTHPFESEFNSGMQKVQQDNAYDICGITAHAKDRGTASLSIRFLAIAAKCVSTREAQEEIFRILDRVVMRTGCRTESIKEELREAWGWNAVHDTHIQSSDMAIDLGLSTQEKLPHGLENPAMEFADFPMDHHPYQDYYVAPHHDMPEYQYHEF